MRANLLLEFILVGLERIELNLVLCSCSFEFLGNVVVDIMLLSCNGDICGGRRCHCSWVRQVVDFGREEDLACLRAHTSAQLRSFPWQDWRPWILKDHIESIINIFATYDEAEGSSDGKRDLTIWEKI
jgi:hypothetical protein